MIKNRPGIPLAGLYFDLIQPKRIAAVLAKRLSIGLVVKTVTIILSFHHINFRL